LKLKSRSAQQKEPEPKVMLRMYIQNETFGGNGGDHEGAVCVSFSEADHGGGVWLPKSQIKYSEPDDDGRVVITIPAWLAKKKGLAEVESGLPF
jgi:hypothetical protein